MLAKTAFAALLGALSLYVFFQAVRTTWPENYFAFDSPTDPIISRSLVRYATFRLAPVFFVCLFVVVTLDRTHQRPLAGVIGVIGLHLLATNLLGIVLTMRRPALRRRRVAIIFLQGTIGFGIVTSGAAAYLLRRPLKGIIPRPEDISVAIWTGLAAGVLGAWLVGTTRVHNRPVEALFRRSQRSIPENLLALAQQKCAEYGTDWQIVEAVILVENLQRPKWVRNLERLKSLVHHPGSYGIMQVRSEFYISDEESIDLAISRYFLGVSPWANLEDPDNMFDGMRACEGVFRNYNNDENFVSFAQQALQYLLADPSPEAPSWNAPIL